MEPEHEPARCPICAAVFEASPRTAAVECPGCQAMVRPRLLRHEAVLTQRAAGAGRHAAPWSDGVYLLAEDVRSLWNVGSFFRSIDGLGAIHLFLTGICGIPPDPEIHRTALGADDLVSWSYAPDPLPVLDEARTHGVRLVALEHTDEAAPLETATVAPRTLIVVGNEIQGVSPQALARCDARVHIPMRGHKNSLNVAVAAGIALWHYSVSRTPPATG